MNPLIPALNAELQQIERELRKDPKYQRAALIRELLKSYDTPSEAPNQLNVLRSPSGANGSEEHLSKGAKIKKEVFSLLRQRGAVHRKVLLDHLIAKGLMGQESRPMKSLGKYLWDWGDEVHSPNKDGNWALK
jgi:hypothetical protein